MGLNRTDVFKNAQDPITATSGGSGDMLAANNLSDLASKPTARTNLGVAYGTTAGTVAQGNDARLAAAELYQHMTAR